MKRSIDMFSFSKIKMMTGLFVFAFLAIASSSQATELSADSVCKQHVTGSVWPDNRGVHINAHGGGMLFYEGYYYWFGEHKIEGNAGNYAQVGVHVYRSADLLHWDDCGIALHVDPPQSHSMIEKGCILERPKVIYNAQTRKFVMWFHLERKGHGYSSAFSGVAQSDSVTGPYTFLSAGRANPGIWPQNLPVAERKELDTSVPTLTGSFFHKEMDPAAFLKRDFQKGQMQRDMTLFVDENQKAYHIYASEENGTLHIAELSDDYLTHNGVYSRHFVGRFMEAPAIFKSKGRYYLIMSGCTGWAPNAARSAVADSIHGPWTELGNPCVGKGMNQTFGGQSTFALSLPNGDVMIMFDLWRPQNAIDGRYMWLKVIWEQDKFKIKQNL